MVLIMVDVSGLEKPLKKKNHTEINVGGSSSSSSSPYSSSSSSSSSSSKSHDAADSIDY